MRVDSKTSNVLWQSQAVGTVPLQSAGEALLKYSSNERFSVRCSANLTKDCRERDSADFVRLDSLRGTAQVAFECVSITQVPGPAFRENLGSTARLGHWEL